MVVVMTGSPDAKAYPSPSAEVWAKRAKQDIETSRQRTDEFFQLSNSVKSKKQKERDAKKKKKAEDDAKFKARQQALRDAQNQEREERLAARASALNTVKKEHTAWQKAETTRETIKFQRGRDRVKDIQDGIPVEDELELMVQAANAEMKAASNEKLAEQRRQDEADEAERQAKLKADREKKAEETRARMLAKAAAEKKAETELAYKVKKMMAEETKQLHEVEEKHEKAKYDAGLKQRGDNVAYGEWLKKDHIRTIAERSHERVDPSKMHEGAKFSGIPTDFTPGK